MGKKRREEIRKIKLTNARKNKSCLIDLLANEKLKQTNARKNKNCLIDLLANGKLKQSKYE